MKHSLILSASAALAAAVMFLPPLAQSPVAAQTQSAAAKAPISRKAWTPRRTPDGQPDFQGYWTNNTVTPLERPKGLGAKEFYTEEELAARIKQEGARLKGERRRGSPDRARNRRRRALRFQPVRLGPGTEHAILGPTDFADCGPGRNRASVIDTGPQESRRARCPEPWT